MAQDAQNRVQEAMSAFVAKLDKRHLRGMEKDMHECAAVCCSNETHSMEEVSFLTQSYSLALKSHLILNLEFLWSTKYSNLENLAVEEFVLFWAKQLAFPIS